MRVRKGSNWHISDTSVVWGKQVYESGKGARTRLIHLTIGFATVIVAMLVAGPSQNIGSWKLAAWYACEVFGLLIASRAMFFHYVKPLHLKFTKTGLELQFSHIPTLQAKRELSGARLDWAAIQAIDIQQTPLGDDIDVEVVITLAWAISGASDRKIHLHFESVHQAQHWVENAMFLHSQSVQKPLAAVWQPRTAP